MKSFDVKGEWWLPNTGNPVKVPGILTFDPASHAQLLICTQDYRNWNDDARRSDGRFSIVIGVSEANEEITLVECLPRYAIDERCGPYAQDSVALRTDLVFKGLHWETPEDLTFDQVSASYTHLPNWLVVPSIGDDASWIKELVESSENSSSYKLHFEDVFSPFALKYDDATIHFSSKDSPTTEIDRDVYTTPKYIRIVLGFDKRWQHYFEYINVYIRNFLTLAAARPTYPVDIVGKVSSAETDNEVEIFFPIPGYDISTPIHLHENMLFRFRDVSSDLGGYFVKWLEDYDSCRESHDVYFDYFFNARSAPTTRFLLLTQALEGYHRELYNGQLIDDGEYRCLRRTLEAVTDTLVGDQSFNDIFRSIMERGNDYTFRRRLKRISDTLLKDHFESIFKGDPQVDRDSFVNKTVLTRNYYTHRSQEDEGVIPRERIPDYTHKLDIIIKAFLLIRLGFPTELIARLLMPFVNVHWITP